MVEQALNNISPRPVRRAAEPAVLPRLAAVLEERGLSGLAEHLARLERISALDLRTIDRELARIPRTGNIVEKSAAHLLVRGGKRLRPLLVALAARLGSGLDERGVGLAVAVELVHSATLLHDDVVDLGDKRRGAEAARVVFGNAASIFAGDWLLVEALRRVRATRVPAVLDRLLAVIDEMIEAEALQLERRGRFEPDRSTYFRVIEGKTASLFRWSLFAGGCAGGLRGDALFAAELYGHHLGVAFQLVDDVLDLGAGGTNAEKTLLADVREGKLTYPLLLALERDANLTADLAAIARDPVPATADAAAYEHIVQAVVRTGALDESMRMAKAAISSARECLLRLPEGEARTLLDAVAEATLYRTH